MRSLWFVVCCVVALSTALRAEEPDPAKVKHPPVQTRLWARGPAAEDLKKDLDLTDDQVAKIKASVGDVTKAFEDKPDVKAAEDDLKKAEEARKTAADKVKVLREGENFLNELKKAVLDSVPEDKKAKAAQLIHVKGAGKPAADPKPADAKPADAPKKEDKPKTDDAAKPADAPNDMGGK